MTEAEWLATQEFFWLAEYLRGHKKATRTKTGRRKLQLFNCASLRSLFWDRLSQNWRYHVEAYELLIDGRISKKELDEALGNTHTGNDAAMMVYYALGKYAYGIYGYVRSLHYFGHLSAENQRQQCFLLRDIFGNPFRPVTLDPAWLTWNFGTIPKLAQMIYDQRRFEDLPILGDALEEAGCRDEQILAHCRGPGPHVRGCWVVDLLLGKE